MLLRESKFEFFANTFLPPPLQGGEQVREERGEGRGEGRGNSYSTVINLEKGVGGMGEG